ncbi:MAG: helix-turn-helix transcriptional regulator [Armatimonadetes bacterium]|nr:helix-turn-helix transcriptional regulator [Anaerolineae bacterium]
MSDEQLNPQRDFKPTAELVVTDLETLRVLADPLRLSIIEYLEKPGTVKRIAAKLGKPATKLYYHFNLLEKHALITLVDTRIVSGIIEKQYQASALLYRVQSGLLSPNTDPDRQDLDLTLSSILEDTKNDILESVRDGAVRYGDTSAPDYARLQFRQTQLHLTDAQAEAFTTQLVALLNTFDSDAALNDPKAKAYKVTMIYHPTSRPLGNDDPETGE